MWEFEREAAELNRLSDEGWQLVKPRAFGFSLERNDAVRYRYRLDRNQKPDDRYYASFAEQGWENAGRVNGWTYFRKPYDPALPESEYEIYTDAASYADMLKAGIKQSMWLMIVYAGITLIYLMQLLFGAGHGTLHTLYILDTALFGLCMLMHFLNWWQLRRLRDGGRAPINGAAINISALIACAAAVVILVVTLVSGLQRPVLETRMSSWSVDEGDPVELYFDVTRGGRYCIELSATVEDSVTVWIEDESGAHVGMSADGDVDMLILAASSGECSSTVRLEEGSYTLHVESDGEAVLTQFYVCIDR